MLNPFSPPAIAPEGSGRTTIGTRRSRLHSAGLGSAIGLGVGILLTLAFGTATHWSSTVIFFLTHTGGFVVMGLVIGFLQRLSPIDAAALGVLILPTLAFILDPANKGTWVFVWIVQFACAGAFGGFVISCGISFEQRCQKVHLPDVDEP